MPWWRNAFAMERPGEFRPTPRQEELAGRVAEKVVERRMGSPAILFLETVKPLNFVGSQVMLFLGPLVRTFFTAPDYETIAEFLEHRDGIEILIRRIEEREAAAAARGRAAQGNRA